MRNMRSQGMWMSRVINWQWNHLHIITYYHRIDLGAYLLSVWLPPPPLHLIFLHFSLSFSIVSSVWQRCDNLLLEHDTIFRCDIRFYLWWIKNRHSQLLLSSMLNLYIKRTLNLFSIVSLLSFIIFHSL